MATDDGDLNTTQWAAVIVLLLVLLVPVATALAAWVRQRYTRAVVHLQAALADVSVSAATAAPDAAAPAAEAASALQVQVQPAREVVAEGDPARPARWLRRRVLAVQFVAGLLYWWVLLLCAALALAYFDSVTSAGALAAEPAEASLTDTLAGHLVLWPLLVLPAVLGWAFQAGLPERRVWWGCAAAALCFGSGLAVAGAGWLPAAGVAVAALLLAALLAAFLRPAVRGAGPPLVAALTVGLLVFCLLVLAVAAWDDGGDEALSTTDWLLALGVLLALLAVAGWVAWRMLLRLSRRYVEKRFSDAQLALGAYWGLATALTCGLVLLLSFEERTGASMEWVALAIGLAWGVWRLLQRVALWLARRDAPPPLGALLMLRVFKPSERSEAFTDRFLARWRFAGPVWMIAGPDLAGAYMEPDEFFAFLGGHLRDRFIAREDDVPARVQALDDVRDPDGRFRVNELFCSNSTWQAAVRALIDRAGVVLLDLREFTPARAGTRYELEQLLRRVPLARIVVVADARADEAPVRAAVADAWRHAGRHVSAGPDGAPSMTVLSLQGDDGADLRGLVDAVARAARAGTPG